MQWNRKREAPATWPDFLEAVREARSELKIKGDEECFYRGASRFEYPLLPSLLRWTKGWKFRKVMDVESDLFFEFQSRARQLNQASMSDWDILQFMRHHRVATRLLDWSESLAVALYFALASPGVEEKSPCIWLLNPYALNRELGLRDLISPKNLGWDEKEKDFYDYGDLLLEGKMDFDAARALYPIQKSDRLAAQRGYFTIHGDDHRPLEVQSPKSVRVVKIHRDVIGDARDFLSLAGIDEHVLFPDLDGLQRYLHAKYKLEG